MKSVHHFFDPLLWWLRFCHCFWRKCCVLFLLPWHHAPGSSKPCLLWGIHLQPSNSFVSVTLPCRQHLVTLREGIPVMLRLPIGGKAWQARMIRWSTVGGSKMQRAIQWRRHMIFWSKEVVLAILSQDGSVSCGFTIFVLDWLKIQWRKGRTCKISRQIK